MSQRLWFFFFFFFFFFLKKIYIFIRIFAWKVLKLSLYKGGFVLIILKFNFEVLIKFKSFRVIFLSAYLRQLGYFSSLFVIFSLREFPFQFSIINLCCYHTLLEQS